MYGFNEDEASKRVGKRATPTVKQVWPKLDVFGQRYERDGVYQVYPKNSKGEVTGDVVVVPNGATWVNPDTAPKTDAQAKGKAGAEGDAPKGDK